MSQSLPHVCYVRMFLRNMAAIVSQRSQILYQRGLPGRAHPQDAN